MSVTRSEETDVTRAPSAEGGRRAREMGLPLASLGGEAGKKGREKRGRPEEKGELGRQKNEEKGRKGKG